MLKYLKDIKAEFSGYSFEKFLKDLMAAATVAAVALPLALAFGVGSGSTAAAGLVTAVVAGIIISIFSGASFQISGPTGAMTAILVTLAAKQGMQGVMLAGFFAGVLLIIAAIFKLGRILNFIPSSVITGFTSGIALIIALGQLDNFFGVKSSGELAIFKVISYFTEGFSPDFHNTVIGIFTVLVMIIWQKKQLFKIPASLAALISVLILNFFLKWDVDIVGDIPKSLILTDRLQFQNIDFNTIGIYLAPALSIAALAMIESLLCGASGGKMKNEQMDANREIFAQGIGNLIIPFFGGIPATAAIARTSVAIKSGGVTRMTGILHGVFLVLSMFLLNPVMSVIPLASLSGILLVTAFKMNDWDNIKFIFGYKYKSGISKFIITMIATVMLDLTQAIIIGVVFSIFLIISKLTKFTINLVDVDEAMKEHDLSRHKHIKIVYFTGNLFFGNINKLSVVKDYAKEAETLIFSMQGVPIIDLSGIQAFKEIIVELKSENINIVFAGLQKEVEKEIYRSGLAEYIGKSKIYGSAEEAVIKLIEERDS